MAEPIRLQKFFTDCGILSRRTAEAEIAAGHVRVNGAVATLGDKIDPDTDRVEYRGKLIRPRATRAHTYLMLHKPRGYVTTTSDERGRRKVTDLVKDLGYRVYPVGRLDMDSEGLLLLTDDGDFANHLTHPRHEIPKIYHVTVKGTITPEVLHALSQPFLLDGYRTLPVRVKVIEQKSTETVLEFTLFEGRNRQIRRMCEQTALHITRLTRTAIGKITLGTLPLGKYRRLTSAEVEYLKGNETL